MKSYIYWNKNEQTIDHVVFNAWNTWNIRCFILHNSFLNINVLLATVSNVLLLRNRFNILTNKFQKYVIICFKVISVVSTENKELREESEEKVTV